MHDIHSSDIDASIQEDWQEMVDIMAQICKVKAALIMRMKAPYIEVCIASQSEDNPYHPGDKEYFDGSGLYCETVISTKKTLCVPNALADMQWINNPDVALNMISYLGFPLLLPDGTPFGTLCVLDDKRNEYSALIEQLMMKFKHLIESQLELIWMNKVLGDSNRQLKDYLNEIHALRGFVSICSHCKAIRDNNGVWHPIEQYLVNHPTADFSHGMCPVCMKKLYPDYNEETS